MTERQLHQEVVSLRDYVEAMIADRDHRIDLAREEVDRRLHTMNEFRDQLARERGDYVLKEAYAPRHEEIVRRLDEHTSRLAEQDNWRSNVIGRAVGFGVVGGVFVAVVTAVVVRLLLGH